MFTVVALGPVTCLPNGTGSQLTTVNKKRIITYNYNTMLLFILLSTCFYYLKFRIYFSNSLCLILLCS